MLEMKAMTIFAGIPIAIVFLLGSLAFMFRLAHTRHSIPLTKAITEVRICRTQNMLLLSSCLFYFTPEVNDGKMRGCGDGRMGGRKGGREEGKMGVERRIARTNR